MSPVRSRDRNIKSKIMKTNIDKINNLTTEARNIIAICF